MPFVQIYSDALVARVIAEYLAGSSTHQLSERHDIARRTIKRWMDAREVRMRTREERQHRLKCREDAFADAENDEEAAYWVGFLMADGCVHHGRNTAWVILSLAAVDGAHVEKFREFIKSKHRITAGVGGSFGPSSFVRLTVGSRQLANGLELYGVVPKKTAHARVIRLETNRHFWRGVIDGDGSVGLALRRNPAGGLYKPRAVLQLCGSHELMIQFADFAAEVCGSTARPHRSKSIWAVGLTSGPAVAMIRYLYLGARVSLDRKQLKAEQIVSRNDRQASQPGTRAV